MFKANKTEKMSFAFVVLIVLFAGNAWCTQNTIAQAGANPSGSLAGKTIWIVDVNTNEYYTAYLQLALIDQLPHFATGVTVQHVITNENGNPFFLLRPEKYPDAVIVSLGMCESSIKNVANYISEAQKKGIPAVMVALAKINDQVIKWNQTYRNPYAQIIEVEKIPQNYNDAVPMAIQILPGIFEKLHR